MSILYDYRGVNYAMRFSGSRCYVEYEDAYGNISHEAVRCRSRRKSRRYHRRHLIRPSIWGPSYIYNYLPGYYSPYYSHLGLYGRIPHMNVYPLFAPSSAAQPTATTTSTSSTQTAEARTVATQVPPRNP
jgi:hypothetical protein